MGRESDSNASASNASFICGEVVARAAAEAEAAACGRGEWALARRVDPGLAGYSSILMSKARRTSL